MKQKKAEEILERRKKEIQQAKKDEKDKMAREEYERWLVIYIYVLHYIKIKEINVVMRVNTLHFSILGFFFFVVLQERPDDGSIT